MRQMVLKTIIHGIVHRVRQTRAHFPTMASSFKFSLGTVCLPSFAASISAAMHCRSPQILDFSFYTGCP